MGPISTTTAIDAPRERVFETVADLALRPAFCDHFIEDYRLARMDSTGAGAAARFRVEPPLSATWMDTVIVEVEPHHLISEDGHCGRLNRTPVFTSWELLEGAGGETTVTLTFWTEPAHALDRAREMFGAGRWYTRKWSVALRRLKRLIEEDGPLPRVGVGGGARVPGAAA